MPARAVQPESCELPFPELETHPAIPRAAQVLMPELGSFPDETTARRVFHEAWLLTRRIPGFDRFHAIDIAFFLFIALVLVSLITAIAMSFRPGSIVLILVVGAGLWYEIARKVNLRRSFRLILREHLCAQGEPHCLACGRPVEVPEAPVCPHCLKPWQEATAIKRLVKSWITSSDRQRYPALNHFETFSEPLRAKYGAKQAWKRDVPAGWRRTRNVTGAVAVAVILLAALTWPFTNAWASLFLILGSLALGVIAVHEDSLYRPFARIFITARLALEGKLLCVRCNYDIAALRADNPNCPECGEPIPAVQQQAWRRYTSSGSATGDVPTPGDPAPAQSG
ncbi:MAG: hypothetical protein KDA21_15235 [Phycisphaerales bacterium]|nr:hypothetical protein [Phycisphaerales bacterium]